MELQTHVDLPEKIRSFLNTYRHEIMAFFQSQDNIIDHSVSKFQSSSLNLRMLSDIPLFIQ